jgi:hypothetical protein
MQPIRKNQMKNTRKELTHCEFIKELLPECYCTNLKSANVPKMLEFCGGDYTKCPLYRQKTSGK